MSSCFVSAAPAVVAGIQLKNISETDHLKRKASNECSYNKKSRAVPNENDRQKVEKRAACDRHYICADKSQT